MIVVGLDPGTQRSGFAVIRVGARSKLEVIDWGVWKLALLADSGDLGARLETLYDQAHELFSLHNPRHIGLERAFNHKNVLSTMKLSEARAVLRLAAYKTLASAESRLIEISPTAVKRAVSGHGQGSKDFVLRSVMARFGISSIKDQIDFTLDASDALAVAWATVQAVRTLKGAASARSDVLR
jgi:crossover junction endodeoxyribonuclease RuvC